jgi:hypothetical protein
MRDAIMRIQVPRALMTIQMDIRRRFGLHRQSNSPRVEHVSRGTPQGKICPGREPVVNRTCPTLGTFHLAPSNSSLPTFLANLIPRIYCGRPWHGRSYPPPPQELPPHGAFRYLAIPKSRVRLDTWGDLISVVIQAGFIPSWKKRKTSACI